MPYNNAKNKPLYTSSAQLKQVKMALGIA